MDGLEQLPQGVTVIDTGYVRPRFAACFLVQEGGRAALVETGTTLTAPRVLAALDALGVRRDAVDWVVATHVHLDHAGGAGTLLQALPEARLAVHPAGARHLVDPSRLVAGSAAVYGGAERLRQLYGEVVPAPAERVLAVDDGQVLDLAGRALVMLHTPGHARHHLAVLDDGSRSVCTGDVFGLGYPDLATPAGPFLFPTTAPTQFAPEDMRASVDRIVDLAPRRVLLTHFGALEEVAARGRDLRAILDAWLEATEAVAARHLPGPAREAALADALRADLRVRYRAAGGTLRDEVLDAWLAMDTSIDASGLLHWWDHRQRG